MSRQSKKPSAPTAADIAGSRQCSPRAWSAANRRRIGPGRRVCSLCVIKVTLSCTFSSSRARASSFLRLFSSSRILKTSSSGGKTKGFSSSARENDASSDSVSIATAPPVSPTRVPSCEQRVHGRLSARVHHPMVGIPTLPGGSRPLTSCASVEASCNAHGGPSRLRGRRRRVRRRARRFTPGARGDDAQARREHLARGRPATVRSHQCATWSAHSRVSDRLQRARGRMDVCAL